MWLEHEQIEINQDVVCVNMQSLWSDHDMPNKKIVVIPVKMKGLKDTLRSFI